MPDPTLLEQVAHLGFSPVPLDDDEFVTEAIVLVRTATIDGHTYMYTRYSEQSGGGVGHVGMLRIAEQLAVRDILATYRQVGEED